MSDNDNNNNTDTSEGEIVGEVAPQTRQILASLRASADSTVVEIGRLELRKATLIGNINQMNHQAQELLVAEAKRLGIPDDVPWRVTNDGKAQLVPVAPAAQPEQQPQKRGRAL